MPSVSWRPQAGPQLDAIQATWCDELFFGGARGGGKSDYLLGDYGQDVSEYGAAWTGVLFRETYPELEEVIARSREIYLPMGAEYKEQSKTWHFPGGATLKMRFLERDADADRYQGHQYAWMGWDELPKRKSLAAYHKLKACLRSAKGVDRKRIRSSGNPGGACHHEVKTYFGIDRFPKGYKPIDDPVTKMTRMFIPSKVQDNRILMEQDPNYVSRLKGTGSDTLVRAWLDGDWNVVVGAFFDCWNAEKHAIRPFTIPETWTRFRAFDWGSYRPFSVGWYAVSDGTLDLPRGALVKYREWYGMKEGEPNTGLKLDADEVADGIKLRERGEKMQYGVADPSIFKVDGGPSIGERMARRGVAFRPADNSRIVGWDQLRARLIGEDSPMIYFFSTCVDSIRTIPAAQHDELKPEDIDTDGEDHALDETRYACMSRPYVKDKPLPRRPLDAALTFQDVIENHDRLYDESLKKGAYL